MNLHLFSMPGEYPLGNVVAACKPYLVGQIDPVLLYLPAAEGDPKQEYLDLTCSVFEDFARVAVLDLIQPLPFDEAVCLIETATVLYIPGGNTYLLLDRLYRSGVFHLIQARVQGGMPLVGFSAGMVVCGVNILTSNDKNECGITEFSGLGFTKYNFNAHYPSGDLEARDERDSRIRAYHSQHANPVLALEDDGVVEVDSTGIRVVRGHSWLFEPGRQRVLLEPESWLR